MSESIPCKICDGTGHFDYYKLREGRLEPASKTCSNCNGTGVITIGVDGVIGVCPSCDRVIREGDRVVEMVDGTLHKECYDNLPVADSAQS